MFHYAHCPTIRWIWEWNVLSNRRSSQSLLFDPIRTEYSRQRCCRRSYTSGGILRWNACELEIFDLKICVSWDTLAQHCVLVTNLSRYLKSLIADYQIADRKLRTSKSCRKTHCSVQHCGVMLIDDYWEKNSFYGRGYSSTSLIVRVESASVGGIATVHAPEMIPYLFANSEPWELGHPAYSLDILLSNFCLFAKQRHQLIN
jgi:hypothetical protein